MSFKNYLHPRWISSWSGETFWPHTASQLATWSYTEDLAYQFPRSSRTHILWLVLYRHPSDVKSSSLTVAVTLLPAKIGVQPCWSWLQRAMGNRQLFFCCKHSQADGIFCCQSSGLTITKVFLDQCLQSYSLLYTYGTTWTPRYLFPNLPRQDSPWNVGAEPAMVIGNGSCCLVKFWGDPRLETAIIAQKAPFLLFEVSHCVLQLYIINPVFWVLATV